MSHEDLEILDQLSKKFVGMNEFHYWHQKALLLDQEDSTTVTNTVSDTNQYDSKQSNGSHAESEEKNVSNLWNLYKYDSMIGSGASCHVMSAFRKIDNKKVAIKEIKTYKNLNMSNREQINLEQFENEYKSLIALSNSRLLNMLDAYKDNNHYFIVSEYLKGTTLTQMIIDRQNNSNITNVC